MPNFVAQWDYSSSYGAFKKGQTIELEQAEADKYNRDSPGILKPVGKEQAKTEEEPETKREFKEPPQKRQVTEAKSRNVK